MKYMYHGVSGHNLAIAGEVFDGREIDESQIQPGALAGFIGEKTLTPIKSKPIIDKPSGTEDSP